MYFFSLGTASLRLRGIERSPFRELRQNSDVSNTAIANKNYRSSQLNRSRIRAVITKLAEAKSIPPNPKHSM